MSDSELLTESGLLHFDSMPDLRRYLGDLLKHYEHQADVYGEQIGRLMRDRERANRNSRKTGFPDQNWAKVGLMYVNMKDPTSGVLEVLLEAMDDYKAKAARTMEILKGFEKLEDLNVSSASTLTMFVKNGVPFRLIVDQTPRQTLSKQPLTLAA